MKIAIPLTAVLLLGPVRGSAEPKPTGRDHAAAARSTAPLDAFPRGPAFTTRGERYAIVSGVHALRRRAAETDAQTALRAGVASDAVVARHHEFVVLRGRGHPGARAHAVAVSARTGRLGLVTGSLEARLDARADAAALATAHGLAVASVAPRIGAAFFEVPPGRDLHAAASELARDPRVTSVEIEVITHFDVPH